MTDAHARRHPPGPRATPLIGSYFAARSDPLRLFTEGRNRFGDVVGYRFGPVPYVVLTSPEAIEHVFLTARERYRRSRNYRFIQPMLGRGLLTEDGDAWQRPRRSAMEHLARNRLDKPVAHVAAGIEDTLREWEARSDPAIDVRAEMLCMTLRITGRWLMSVDIADKAASLNAAAVGMLRIIHQRAKSPLQMLPLRLPTPTRRKFRGLRKQLDDVVLGAISAHRAAPDAYDDVLAGLLAPGEDGEAPLSEEAVRDATATLLVAGHESLGASLTWAWTLLTQHPEVAARVRAEADAVLGDRSPTLADAAKLVYTGRVFDEVLRLYPPGWMVERRPLEDDEIAGYHVPRNTTVGACLWALHRNPKLFPDPDRFDPDRFEPERRSAWHRCAYIPYSVGPQTCVGAWLAWAHGRLVLAAVARRFVIDVTSPRDVVPDPGLMLRPRDAVPATLRRRS